MCYYVCISLEEIHMQYLALAIICSSLISIVMRVGTYKVNNKLSMLAANYATCFILAALIAGPGTLFPASPQLPRTLLLGFINGFVFLSAFVLMQRSVKASGVVLSTTFSKLGLLVPVLVSVAVFGESPSLLHIIGFVLAVIAIIMINPGDGEKSSGILGLVILLTVCGSADAMNKIYSEIGAAELSSQFLLYTFMSAFALCMLLVIHGKEKPGKYELFFGILLGVPNYFSARFALMSLSYLPAVIVYPTISVSTILLVSLVGILAFKERLIKQQWLALGIIIVAVALLNI